MALNKIGGGERVFCNPPYNKLKDWIKKAYEEKDNAECIVLLIPARTDTAAFHEYIYHQAEVRFIQGRLKFGDATGSAPFPSMIVVYRKSNRWTSFM